MCMRVRIYSVARRFVSDRRLRYPALRTSESSEAVVESRVALSKAQVEQRDRQTKGPSVPTTNTGVEADVDAMAVEQERKVVDESGYEQHSGEVVESAKPVVSEKAKRANIGGYEQLVRFSGEVVEPAKVVVNEKAKDGNIGMGRFSNFPGEP